MARPFIEVEKVGEVYCGTLVLEPDGDVLARGRGEDPREAVKACREAAKEAGHRKWVHGAEIRVLATE